MTEQRRYSLIDAIRAVAVINMLLFHLCYDIFVVFGVWTDFYRALPIVIWERLICFVFIVISGISLNFTRSGCRRGLIVLLCGVIVTAATVWLTPEQEIWFGILHFLGLAMLVGYGLKPLLEKIKPLWGMAVFFILFMLCYGIPDGFIGLLSVPLIPLPEAMYRFTWLSFLGFRTETFFSADYFPFLQWIFLYFFGCELWRFLSQKKLDRYFCRRIPVLDFIGRHSLIIYMIHQPLLYGACYLIFTLSGSTP